MLHWNPTALEAHSREVVGRSSSVSEVHVLSFFPPHLVLYMGLGIHTQNKKTGALVLRS